jgi:serine phosphatase RsbU (regulator of sigma subunit)
MRARIRAIVRGLDRDLAIKLETVVHGLVELKRARAAHAEAEASAGRLRGLLRERMNALAVQSRINRSANKLGPDRIDLAAQWKPCAGVSGDWWAAYPLRDGRVALVLADALGHGASAALLAALGRGACDLIMRRVDPEQIHAGVVLAELNAALRDAGSTHTEMTCAVTMVDPARNALTVASAGHPLPLWLPVAGGGELRSLGSVGPGLGAEAGARYDEVELELAPGDLWLLFSDGLLDSAEGRPAFGVRQLRRSLESLRGRDPRAVRDGLWLALKSARGDAPPADDITYVVARLLPPS